MTTMKQSDFIEFVAEVAIKDWKERRIMLPSVVTAQACKESGFGQSELAKNANALFGVKLNGWTGESYMKIADEQNLDGSFRTDEDCLWRKYKSWEESIIDHTTYIAERRIGNQTEPNFKEIIGETNVKKVIAGLVGNYGRQSTADRCTDLELKQYILNGKTQFGYHTGLGYSQSLLDDYIVKYNLTKYDIISESKEVIEMSNSSLVNYKNISPNRTTPRNHKVDTITIHCMAAQWTAKQACDYFSKQNIQASSNYCVGYDGSIGLSVEEKDRSWCSSNRDNDHRAITIEVASDKAHPYTVTGVAMKSLIALCVDICKRNGIERLVWSDSKHKRVNHLDGCNMTVHRDFAAKACPGEYLYERQGYIADEVNKLLNKKESETDVLYKVQCGAFGKKENAKALQDKLKASGFEAIIVEVKK